SNVVGQRVGEINDRHEHREGESLRARRTIVGRKRQGGNGREHRGKSGAKADDCRSGLVPEQEIGEPSQGAECDAQVEKVSKRQSFKKSTIKERAEHPSRGS